MLMASSRPKKSVTIASKVRARQIHDSETASLSQHSLVIDSDLNESKPALQSIRRKRSLEAITTTVDSCSGASTSSTTSMSSTPPLFRPKRVRLSAEQASDTPVNNSRKEFSDFLDMLFTHSAITRISRKNLEIFVGGVIYSFSGYLIAQPFVEPDAEQNIISQKRITKSIVTALSFSAELGYSKAVDREREYFAKHNIVVSQNTEVKLQDYLRSRLTENKQDKIKFLKEYLQTEVDKIAESFTSHSEALIHYIHQNFAETFERELKVVKNLKPTPKPVNIDTTAFDYSPPRNS
jgi:hypothetical protein